MSNKPIFVATHPRACSTAFERVFMTRRETIQCVHEPFGDAFYFGPERLGERYEGEDKKKEREDSGFAESTYRTIFERIRADNSEGKRVLIKDMAYYLMPPNGASPQIAPSLLTYKRGVGTVENGIPQPLENGDADDIPKIDHTPPYPYPTQGEPGNPTVIPEALLSQFHFTFLIRHPKHSISSYIRCTTPPIDEITGWHHFLPAEAGYAELRRLFDYLRSKNYVGPENARDAAKSNGVSTNGTTTNGKVSITIIDADDLLDSPASTISQFCHATGIPYEPEMLTWDSEESHQQAKEAFEKWRGWHDDAINSTELKPRGHHKEVKGDEELFVEWTGRFGEDRARVMRECVRRDLGDYEYLKGYAIRP